MIKNQKSPLSPLKYVCYVSLAADWLLFWAYYQKSQEKLSANISMLNEDLTQGDFPNN